MAAPILQFKRGLFTNLPGLRAGEPGFTTDSYDLYIGLTSETSTNKFFGSHRYWTKEDGTNSLKLNLVDKDGTNYVSIAASDTLAGVATYRLPDTTNGTTGDFLKVKSVADGYYDLEWSPIPSGSFTITGDSGSDTFTTGETLTFSGGEGIDTTITDNTVTIDAEIASASNAGIASFSASYFSVAAGGDVSIGDADADGSTKGIAAFDTDDFDASSGVISLGDSANGAVLAINGTTDEVEVSRTNGTVTVGLPNNVVVGGGLTATTFTLAGVAVTAILDEDTMVSDRADALATQQSIKAYVDTTVGNVDLTIDTAGDSGSGSVSTSQTLTISGTTNEIETSASGQSITIGLPNNVVVGGGLTATTFTLAGVAVTAILDEDTMASDRADALATQQSIKAYVDTSIGNVDLTITTAEGTNGTGGGGGSVATSQTLTFNGTASEIDVTVSGQSVTYGLPDAVVVGTSLSAPTIRTGTIQSSNTGAAAITIAANDVTIVDDLTVGGNLYVNGNTTQVNTTSLTVEDTLVELGLVDGSAPGSDLNKDIGLLFNYYTDSAKKSAVYWDDSASRIVLASEVSESSSVLTASAYAALEIGSLWVNDCAGQSQVINCSGSTRTLENITIDAGSF